MKSVCWITRMHFCYPRERPILDAKYDLMKHPNIRYTDDGGAGPFNYAKAPLAHDDFTFDETRYDDYELLLDEDIIGELF